MGHIRARTAALTGLILLGASCTGSLGSQTTISTSSPQATAASSPSPVAAPLTITRPAFHSGEAAVNYEPVTLAATGGVPPYEWTISSGGLPGGMSLSASGIVTGTPSSPGDFRFGVHAHDVGGSTAEVAALIGVYPALTTSLMPGCTTACSVEQGCVTVCGGFATQSGGAGPFKYSVTQGAVAPGTSLSHLSLVGNFSTVGTFKFAATVIDGFGAISTITPTFAVFAHIAFPGGTIGACPPKGCTQQFPYSGGAGTPTSKIEGWVAQCAKPPCVGPPPMPTVAIGGGYVTVSVPAPVGNWSAGYTANLTVLLTDQSPCYAGAMCSVAGIVRVVAT